MSLVFAGKLLLLEISVKVESKENNIHYIFKPILPGSATYKNIKKRVCHLMTEFVNRVEDDESRNALALCVTRHREEMKGFTKNWLVKC